MTRSALLAALPAALLFAMPAQAAISVLGTTTARGCYEAARDERAGPATIRLCTDALADRSLGGRDRVATLVNRGILHVRSGDFASGLDDYDRALALDPEEPDAHLNKGLALLRRDQAAEQALPLFDRAIELGTREPAVAYYGRSLAHELAGDISAAYHDTRRAAELAPEWEAPARNLARFVVRE